MENMGAVAVHVNTILSFRINIACQVIPAVDHEAFLSRFLHFISENSSVKTCPCNEIIKLHNNPL